jgi:hypothetical protein
LSSKVNLVIVLNTELDHALDELGKAHAEYLHLKDGSSPLLGHNTLTARCHVVVMLMAPLTAGPR